MICPKCNKKAKTLYGNGDMRSNYQCQSCVDAATTKTVAMFFATVAGIAVTLVVIKLILRLF